MQISKTLINFINDYENKELLNNFKFKELYKKLNKPSNGERIGQFTALMYEAKINPLLYLDEVPKCFLFRNTDVKNIDIPSNITYISEYAFYDCDGLTSVTIPGNVKSIGEFAFADCSSLTSVVISNGLTSIGNMTFDGCSSLTSVTIPDSVTEIGYYAFSHCYGLTSITIPCSVNFIEVSAFTGCKALKSINYLGTKKQWRNLLNGKRLVGFPRGYIIHCTDGDINVK